MHYLSLFRKDFRYFLKKYVGDLDTDSQVEKMINILFSEKIYSSLRGGFWAEIKRKRNILKPVLLKRVIESDRSLGAIFRILVEEGTRSFGYNKCLIKFPVHVAYVQKLKYWYPNAKIIQITRCPMATTVSKMSDPGGTIKLIKKYPVFRKGIIIGAKFYVILQYIISSYVYKNMKGTKGFEIFSFEELVHRPEKTLRKLCRFIEIKYINDMHNPNIGQPSSITGKYYRKFNSEVAVRWKYQMSKWEYNIINFMTRSSIKRLGNEPQHKNFYSFRD